MRASFFLKTELHMPPIMQSTRWSWQGIWRSRKDKNHVVLAILPQLFV